MDRLRERRRAGFTLLELLAVLLIGGLLMSFIVPNMSAMRSRALKQHAERIVATADLARQRAVVTGVEHRLVIDLDDSSYRLEWLASTDTEKEKAPVEDALMGLMGEKLSLAPPKREEQSFKRLPGLLGRVEFLGDGIEFAEIGTPGGWVESDTTFVVFERDGTASFTTIVLNDPDGREIILEIPPLADTVRIFYEEL